MEKMIQIPEWHFKHIENALRLTNNVCSCYKKETAFDRELVKAYGFAKEALAKVETRDSGLNIDIVMRSAFKEAFEHWNNCRSDADMGNWLYAKSKGITP